MPKMKQKKKYPHNEFGSLDRQLNKPQQSDLHVIILIKLILCALLFLKNFSCNWINTINSYNISDFLFDSF